MLLYVVTWGFRPSFIYLLLKPKHQHISMKMFDLAWSRGKFKFSKKPSCMLDWGLLLLKNRVVKIALDGFSLKLPKQKSENGVWFNFLFFFHRGVQRETLISFWVWHESQGAGLSLHWSLCKKTDDVGTTADKRQNAASSLRWKQCTP